MILRVLLSSLFLLLLDSSVQAQEVLAGSVFNPSQEAEVTQRARRRVYPGGRDEGEIAVQVQMTTPTRKIAPQVAPPPEAESDSE